MRHLFPQGRRPSDDTLDPLIYICHFILSRINLDYGSDLIMDLMQESSLSSVVQMSQVTSPDRVAVGIRAAMLSISCMGADTTPSWPSNPDFSIPVSPVDYPSVATSFSPEILARPEVSSLIERFGSAVAKLGMMAVRSVGGMSVLDPRYRYEHSANLDEREQLAVRQHPDETVCSFPRALTPQLDLLQSCFDTWPRCLHSSLQSRDVIDAAIRSVAHADPAVAAAATRCLLRFASEGSYVESVLKQYTRSLFGSPSIAADSNWLIATEHTPRVELWIRLVQCWADMKAEDPEIGEDGEVVPLVFSHTLEVLIDEIEAGGLFLLASTSRSTRPIGLRALRLIPTLRQKYTQPDVAPLPCIIDVLSGKPHALPLPMEGSLLLPDQESERTHRWRGSNFPDYLLRLIESSNPLDHSLWSYMLPTLVRDCITQFPSVLNAFRETLSAAVLRYHALMSALAGMSSKPVPVGATTRAAATPSRGPPPPQGHDMTSDQRRDVQQWGVWIMALCACVNPSEDKPHIPREHARLPSDISGSRERLSSAKGLFRHLIPFLASEFPIFRDAVVGALGCTHAATFRHLLDDLRSIATHILDPKLAIAQRGREQDRIHVAVVRVYALTAEFINNSSVYHDSTTVALLWNVVQSTQSFLARPEVRMDAQLTRLRRYFCHIVEQLFNVPDEILRNVVPARSYLTLYRLIELWCPYGQGGYRDRIREMDNIISSRGRGSQDRKVAIERFHLEEQVLVPSAASAMAVLLVS